MHIAARTSFGVNQRGVHRTNFLQLVTGYSALAVSKGARGCPALWTVDHRILIGEERPRALAHQQNNVRVSAATLLDALLEGEFRNLFRTVFSDIHGSDYIGIGPRRYTSPG